MNEETQEMIIAKETTAKDTTTSEETTTTESLSEEATSLKETTEEIAVDPSEGISSMSMPFIGVSVVQCAVAIVLIIIILQQSKTASSITASSALVGSSPKTYWDKNKGRSKEYKLSRLTVILGAVFLVLCFVLSFMK